MASKNVQHTLQCLKMYYQKSRILSGIISAKMTLQFPKTESTANPISYFLLNCFFHQFGFHGAAPLRAKP